MYLENALTFITSRSPELGKRHKKMTSKIFIFSALKETGNNGHSTEL